MKAKKVLKIYKIDAYLDNDLDEEKTKRNLE